VLELCRHARQQGYRQLALTDIDNLYGLWPFLAACEAEGLVPIIGAALTAPSGTVGRRTGGESNQLPSAYLLVENEEGYRNLCRILTARHCAAAFSLTETVPRHAAGLSLLTTDQDLLLNWHEQGLTIAAALPHGPTQANGELRKLASRLARPAMAVPASFFTLPADFALHRLLCAIRGNTTLSCLTSADTVSTKAWLAGPAEYRKRFAVWPETLAATAAIAERCLFRRPVFGTVMPPHAGGTPLESDQELRKKAYLGARYRYGDDLSEAVVERLEHELTIISHMGFSSYFLVVRDIVPAVSRTCGRGSGAASLVAYCLGLTNVCPVKHNLYFERFLNPGRQDPPDLDIDFAWDERDDVLNQVMERFGDRAAMVSSHILFQPRMAIREVAKVYGLADAEIGRVTKRLPWLWHGDADEDEGLLNELQKIPNLKDLDFPRPWPEIIGQAERLIGTPRYLSVHPGGVVITPRPVGEYVPVERAPKGVPIIQWEKDSAEDAGLVKIDLLGNRSLAVIRDAIANLRANGRQLDENLWQPEDDPATQKVVAAGQTMGCFYIESPAMRLLQQKAGQGDFSHLVIQSSIIRPAANEFIREYIRRLRGGAWQPIHPLLAEALEETYGIMVFQEDVSRVAVALAGFSHADADGLRKILSKKDRKRRLPDFYNRFSEGCGKNGLTAGQIEEIWQMMLSFSGYSFCKPHSASYAKVSFQAAWLKVHFPAEFMAGVISNQGGFYSTFAYVSEARRLGLTILPPDVQVSVTHWTGKGKDLRVGLMAMRQVSQTCQEMIVAERQHRSFSGLTDFLERVRPSEEEASSLLRAGALDSLAPQSNRAELRWELACWQVNRPASGSAFLFPVDALSDPATPPPKFPPENPLARRHKEFETLGFLVNAHPMELFVDLPRRAATVKVEGIASQVGKRVRFAGWLITGKTVSTKQGEAMEFLTFEDETGLIETTFFPKTYARYCHLLTTGRPYLLSGLVEEDFGAVTVTVEAVALLSTRQYC